ncbi:thiamine pyrophosphate-binding protein [Nocardia fusca]|uniref:thiamine pyrophosphate-binding protein n=1 Tax=Nocardia fusca TaxID=941183 RepID=UPI0037A66859
MCLYRVRRIDGRLSRALATAGVRHVFGVDAADIEDLYDALVGSEITGVIAEHEFFAAAMADGCARTTRRLGVVAARSAGAAMNLDAGLA